MKLPPFEKIPEAYTALEDNRVKLQDNEAIVKSSNGEKEYVIKWKENIYFSNDAATFWQGYVGYPVIAVLMLQGKLSWNKEVSSYFKKINWNQLNKETKRDYQKSFLQVIGNLKKEEQEKIKKEINKVYEEIKELKIELTRKKNLVC